MGKKRQRKSNSLRETPRGCIPTARTETDDEILECLESPASSVEPIKPITPKELQKEIGLLNTKKAPGMDLITPKMLKELPQKGMILLTHLFNAILRLS